MTFRFICLLARVVTRLDVLASIRLLAVEYDGRCVWTLSNKSEVR